MINKILKNRGLCFVDYFNHMSILALRFCSCISHETLHLPKIKSVSGIKGFGNKDNGLLVNRHSTGVGEQMCLKVLETGLLAPSMEHVLQNVDHPLIC